jgi:glycosyltransferase involved in cell wall biosynthesis
MMATFPGKVGLVQRVLPSYRVPFFNGLGQACKGGLALFAGEPRPAEMIQTVDHLDNASLKMGKNIHLLHGSLYLCIQVGLIKWLEDTNPQVLIMEANPRYVLSAKAIQWMHKRKRPVIGWGLGAPPLNGSFFTHLRITQRKKFIHQFDNLITYSQNGAQEYTRLGFPENHIFVARNAVTPPPAHPLPFREEPAPGGRSSVLFVGRLQARKNIENLIKACADMKPSLRPELVIVGDGPAKESLAALASQIYPQTIFTGALYGDLLAEQFRQTDLFVLPGTGGLAVQEAMSYALPVIAAEADGTQQDLVRPTNGWQIPSNDIPALRSTLEDALSNVQRLRQMGAESYRIVAQEINLDQMVSVFIKALNRSMP